MKVLLIAAHPDDTEFICGGTIASLTARSAEVGYVVASNGLAGLRPGADTGTRVLEQKSAAKALSVRSVEFIGLADGTVEPTLELREQLTRVIRRTRPDLVLTHSPDRNYSSVRFSHPDHLAVGHAALAAVYPDARTEGCFPSLLEEGLAPHSVPEVWLFGNEQPNHVVDITDTFEDKIVAVMHHQSQLGAFGDVREFFREWAQEVAEQQELPSGRLAEQYRVLDTS